VVSRIVVVEPRERSIASVLAEIKDELREFAQTRLSMLQSELKDNVAVWKAAVPMIVVALVLGGTAWFLLTGALVAIIGNAFLPNRLAYFFSLIIVGAAYLLVATIIGSFAYRELKTRGFKPERTLKVLKDDQAWIRTEARTQS
jgi:VIT1/CCC1 family predicted Fe2+/Mn2+ transporter